MSIEVHEERNNPASFSFGTKVALVHLPDELLNAWVGVPLENPLEAMPNNFWYKLMDTIESYLQEEVNEERLLTEYRFSIEQLREMMKATK